MNKYRYIHLAFGFSNAKYGQMVWDQGRQWIKRNICQDEYSIDIVEQSPLFGLDGETFGSNVTASLFGKHRWKGCHYRLPERN